MTPGWLKRAASQNDVAPTNEGTPLSNQGRSQRSPQPLGYGSV